jgi:hypothetical protein
MKRSSRIRLVLIGGLSAGALTGCSDNPSNPALSQGSVYTNNYFVPGAGYYHAPFRAWYPVPYNHFDPETRRYYFGGEWADAPHLSITNISSPTEQSAQTAQSQRTDITRGGFGSTSHFLGVHS